MVAEELGHMTWIEDGIGFVGTTSDNCRKAHNTLSLAAGLTYKGGISKIIIWQAKLDTQIFWNGKQLMPKSIRLIQ